MSAICERLSRFRSEILYLNDVRKGGEDDNYVPPIVYGEVKSKANPNGKTILFYNHYDVQPEERRVPYILELLELTYY
ncbi:MAG: hypothetical protein WA421_05280 [Nitrososphaeraceae archaeon]